jgi:hypothetical protein
MALNRKRPIIAYFGSSSLEKSCQTTFIYVIRLGSALGGMYIDRFYNHCFGENKFK